MLNGAPITNANNVTYVISQSGNYTVIVTDGNGCTSESDPFAAVFSSIAEEQNQNLIVLVPNPAQEQLTIQGAKFVVDDEITLTDVTGKVLYHTKINQPVSAYQISVQDLTYGIYLITLQTSSFQKVLKMIKQ